MDSSLAKALSTRFVAELLDRERVIHYVISTRAGAFGPTTKGARKAVAELCAQLGELFIDSAVFDNSSMLRVCTINTNAPPAGDAGADAIADVALTLETIDVDPKKQVVRKLGVRICLSKHALQRLVQRAPLVVPRDANQLDYTPVVDCLRDANVWCQTVINAMRVAKVLGQADRNVNLIIPTRHGAFAGMFSDDMTVVYIRSFLGPSQLGAREEVWSRCRDIMFSTGMDLMWVSNRNFKDPKVIAAFVLAEDAGVFSIDWNRANTSKDAPIDLSGATQSLRSASAAGQTVRRDRPQEFSDLD
jgi:hypothetical protein